ncbi:MAG: caspase family protein [Leptospiraceae bacterium]|nr:caspase family protein [Leptospiraceae bacterium]
MKKIRFKKRGFSFILGFFCVFLFFLQVNIYSEKKTQLYEFIENAGKKEKAHHKINSPQTDKKTRFETTKKQETPEIIKAPEEIEPKEEIKPSRPGKKYILKRKGLGGDEPIEESVKIDTLDGNEGKRYAIVVGINNYNDPEIPALSKARNDAKVIAKILKEKGQFEVYVMTDDIDSKENLYPSKLNIEEKLDTILNFARSSDLIVFFFSGHGISDNDNKGYLVTIDTVAQKQYNTSLKIDNIIERLNSKNIRKSLLVLDACREVVKKTKSTSQNRLKNQEFTEAELSAVFYSTKIGQFSYEDDKSDYGVFTKYLIYGMEGQADTNKDYVVTFDELARFVTNGVHTWSKTRNKNQKPYTKIYGERSGDLALTLRSDPDESLADKRLPQILNKYQIAGLSTLFPGLGQYKNDREVAYVEREKEKKVTLVQNKDDKIIYGAHLGIPYLAIGIIGTGYYYTNYQKLKTLKSDYQNSPFLVSNSLGRMLTFSICMRNWIENQPLVISIRKPILFIRC